MKRERPVVVRDEYAIEHDGMEMRVQAQIRGNTLHNGNRPALPGADAKRISHRTPIETEHRVDEDAPDCAEQFAVIRKAGTQCEWHGEDELSERHSWQNVIHQICRDLGHTSTQTRGTKCSTLTRKRDEALVATLGILALDQSEAPAEQAAVDVALEFALDELGQWRREALLDRCVEREPIFAHHLMERNGFGSAARVRVRAGCRGQRRWHRPSCPPPSTRCAVA
jgi:hypothetical protein